jgi:hypothetical protein
MRTVADAVIDHLGGTSAVAKLIEAPVSTVHSWRSIGIPASRLAHIRLVAAAEGKLLPDDLATLPNTKAAEDEQAAA